MKLPQLFTTVTPLSKIMAILLFTLLPFLGFYLGIKYANLNCLSGKVVYIKTPTLISTVIDDSEWKSFTNPELGYSFKYPTQMSVFGDGMPGRSRFSEYNKLIISSSGNFHQNPSFFMENRSEAPVDLKTYSQNSYNANLSNNKTKQGIKQITFDGRPAWSYILNTDNGFNTVGLEGSDAGGFLTMHGAHVVIFFERRLRLYEIVFYDSPEFNHIFSTLKFFN